MTYMETPCLACWIAGTYDTHGNTLPGLLDSWDLWHTWKHPAWLAGYLGPMTHMETPCLAYWVSGTYDTHGNTQPGLLGIWDL